MVRRHTMNFKRLYRDFKANLTKNITFILLVALSVMVIVGFNRSMDSYIDGVYKFWSECNVEDGHFSLSTPLSKSKLHKLENKYHMKIEECKEVNIDLSPNSSDSPITLRVMSLNRNINLAGIVEGELPNDTYEIALDPKFALAQGYTIGDTIALSHIHYTIVGYAISPEYTYTLEEDSDFLNNPNAFGVGYVTSLGFNYLENPVSIFTTYSFTDSENNCELLKDYLDNHADLISFVKFADNSRMSTVINDVNSPKVISLIMGLLLIAIIAFIISISIKNTIASESQTIGILYSQGFNKFELLCYYLTLPCLLVSLGIIIGYPLGMAMSSPLTISADAQYTIPPFTFRSTPFIFFAGVFLPLFISISITCIALFSSLNQTPLSLLRGQHNSSYVSKLETKLTFKHFSFFSRFRLKDFIREKSSMLSLFFGVLISMFILLTGLYFRDSVLNYLNGLTQGFPYEYMYTFKSNSDLDKYSKQGELIAFTSYKFEHGNKRRSASLYGIQTNSDFYDIPLLSSLEENEVLMAPCMHDKYNLQVGDVLYLIDETDSNKEYPIKIVGYCDYDFGQYFYTSDRGYNYILNRHSSPYNRLLTHNALIVDTEKVANLTTKENIISSSNNLLGMISLFTGIMIITGIIVLVIVIYLLMNMILEKSSINISMVKIFGYTPKEINRLYLNGTVIIVLLGFLPAIPAGHYLCKTFYDIVFEEMDKYFSPHIYPSSLLLAFALMLIGYLGSSFLLKRKVNKIALTEALKNRE